MCIVASLLQSSSLIPPPSIVVSSTSIIRMKEGFNLLTFIDYSCFSIIILFENKKIVLLLFNGVKGLKLLVFSEVEDNFTDIYPKEGVN